MNRIKRVEESVVGVYPQQVARGRVEAKDKAPVGLAFGETTGPLVGPDQDGLNGI